MCEMKMYLPPKIFNVQERYLIHHVEEIEMCGPVHTWSMWMVERHLKSLKVFVKQITHLEGYMVEAFMAYKSLVYISQYLPKFATKMNVPCIWDAESINKFEGEVLVKKGRTRKVKGN